MTNPENVAGTSPARPPPHDIFPSDQMEYYFCYVLAKTLLIITHRSCSLLRPSHQIKLSSSVFKTKFLCTLSTGPLRDTFYACVVFLLGINLYLVPSLFCGGIGFLGQMRIFESN